MKYLLIFFLVFNSLQALGQLNIIPQPVKAEIKQGNFIIKENTGISISGEELRPSLNFIQEYLKKFYGFSLKEQTGNTEGIQLILHSKNKGAESYTINSGNNRFIIEAGDAAGIFYGIQTLIQLLPPKKSPTLTIPLVTIEDYPRFKYRGLHLDVSRHFFPVDFIKKYIDYLALHKMNSFHWHLTDDQGWRIEIKKYPKLTSVGAYRNGTITGRFPGTGNDNIRHGGFYTQDEIKEVVAYAADRYIQIIPEIEMPGHASAALASYPQLGCTGGPYEVQQTFGVFEDVFCAGNELVFEFLQNVIDEIIPLFPSKYIHIGGDECPKTRWKQCPRCQKRIKDNSLKDEYELQSYFIQRMEKYINNKGKTIIGWDEILEGGLAPNAVVMSWRGEEGGITAAKSGHYAIMTPTSHVYLDYSQTRNEDSLTIGGYITTEKTYSYEPVPEQLTEAESKYILGAQGNVWTEYIKNPAKVEYQIFPRATALSEVLWSKKEDRNWESFKNRLMVQFDRYKLWNASFSLAIFDLKDEIIPNKDSTGLLWKLEKPVNEGRILFKRGNGNFIPYTMPVELKESDSLTATLEINGSPSTLLKRTFHIHKASGKKLYLSSPPSPYYTGKNGAYGLVDGILSEKGRSSDEWLGWYGMDVRILIDLGRKSEISSVIAHLLGMESDHIYFPDFMEVEFSDDGKNFTAGGKTSEVDVQSFHMGLMGISFSPIATRYIRISFKNPGIIPADKPGAGNKSWLFIDEILIE